ncbi:unnamed protein product, partial [Ceratitis capitata]
ARNELTTAMQMQKQRKRKAQIMQNDRVMCYMCIGVSLISECMALFLRIHAKSKQRQSSGKRTGIQ